MLISKACDITGIVAIACARHGCFAPNSLTDLYAGEQQRNVDHAFVQALATTNMVDIQMAMLIYDIACQYIVHFLERIGDRLPSGLTVDSAIGLMHVHGHKEDCFFRFASYFIPGAAVVAGEILESLWSVLNSVSPMARTATLAHRSEILDDHMNDSNWKKCLDMRACFVSWNGSGLRVPITASALCSKFEKATDMKACAEAYYSDIISLMEGTNICLWEAEIVDAEERRLEDRKVMDILKARRVDIPAADVSDAASSAPEVVQPTNRDWVLLGLDIEERQ